MSLWNCFSMWMASREGTILAVGLYYRPFSIKLTFDVLGENPLYAEILLQCRPDLPTLPCLSGVLWVGSVLGNGNLTNKRQYGGGFKC